MKQCFFFLLIFRFLKTFKHLILEVIHKLEDRFTISTYTTYKNYYIFSIFIYNFQKLFLTCCLNTRSNLILALIGCAPFKKFLDFILYKLIRWNNLIFVDKIISIQIQTEKKTLYIACDFGAKHDPDWGFL